MGLADDLLRQARHLATYEGANPSQASLGRAVSTAYYALFHLLVQDAGTRWQGSAESRTGFERGFQHGPMKSVSRQFQGATWMDWHGQQRPVPIEVQYVADAFVDLQERRHVADYDNYRQWNVTQVQEVLESVEVAFVLWGTIRTDPMAGNYLLAMILSKQRV